MSEPIRPCDGRPLAAALTRADARALEACIAAGGVAVFPADTVYGLACDPQSPAAVERLYALKGRLPTKPAAILWFDRQHALAAIPTPGPRTTAALERLLPGPVTLLLPNPARCFPLAVGADPDAALGVRVPRLTTPLTALATITRPLLQSSANAAGGADARILAEVPPAIRQGADLVLDAGPLPGTPSTVVDLRAFEPEGTWSVVRAGALASGEIANALGIVGGR